MSELLSANQAAKVIGCSPQKVRERLKRRIWTFGRHISKKDLGNEYKDEYNISINKLADFLGISREDVIKRLESEETA